MATATRAETIRVSNRMGQGCDNHRPRFHGNSDVSVSVRLADLWDCSAREARRRLDRCFKDAADVTTTLMALGQHDRLAALMAPFDAAQAAWQGAPALADALLEAARTDAEEDQAECRLHVFKNRESALAWVKASARARLHAERAEAAVREEWEL